VVKKSGRRSPFDRDKLHRSIHTAIRKRDIDEERIDKLVSGITRRIESQTDGDITSQAIGRMVLDGLKQIDEVAYVRFASVYEDFQEAKDFEGFLREMEEEGE